MTVTLQDCQCARCGSSMGWDDDGDGTYYFCLSGYEWCEAHPRPGRETTPRSTPEWYTYEVAQ